MDNILEMLVYIVAYAMEIIGIIIIVFAGIKSLIFFVQGGLNFNNRLVSLTLAEGLNMSLGFLLAAEIVLSIVIKTIPNLVVLGGIAAIRIILSFVLNWEIKEFEKVADEDHPRGTHYENKPIEKGGTFKK